jgi:hypothetical protein
VSIAPPPASSRPTVAKLAQTALAIVAFVLIVATVAFARTFVFEYFHGDPAMLHSLVQLVLGNWR